MKLLSRSPAIFCASVFAVAAHAGSWTYETKRDPMTDKPTSTAFLQSSSQLKLSFPYAGDNWGNILVRVKAKKSPEVIVMVDKGQMLCRSWEYSCSMQVRFDERPPISFSAIGPSDHSSKAAFLASPERFIAEARKAKRIRIAIELFHEGVNVIEFTPAQPLQWPPT